MKRTQRVRYWVCALSLAAAMLPGAAGASAEEQGRQLAQQVYDRPDGKDMSTRNKMILTEHGHPPRSRTMYFYRRDQKPGEVWSLARFTEPGDIAGTGLLSLDYPGDVSDQWIYLPALKRARRVPSTRKGGRFVGSDLYYEDLQDREVAMDTHRLLGEEELEGAKVLLLESIPVDPSNSAYSKRLSWIHPEVLLPLRIDFYTKGRDEPSKRLKVHRIDKIDGYWTVMDNTIKDLQSGHQTRMVIEEVIYDRDLPESLFERRALEDEASAERFRP